MAGRATLTIEESSAFMNMARPTTTRQWAAELVRESSGVVTTAVGRS